MTETLSHLTYCLRVEYIREERFREIDFLIRKIWKELNMVVASLRRQRKSI
ncbi:MAG: hypothetical protein GTN81_16940 [Proteobacteria bacterium]|nr:hypothetical protein [Pseudomonadota bacterium]